MHRLFNQSNFGAMLLLAAILFAIGCSDDSDGTSETSGFPQGGAPTGTVVVFMTDPSYPGPGNPIKLEHLQLNMINDEGKIVFGPVRSAFQDEFTFKEVPIDATSLVVYNEDDPSVYAEAPVFVQSNETSFVTDVILRPSRTAYLFKIQSAGQNNATQTTPGKPVQIGQGWFQTELSSVGTKGANAVMAGVKAFCVTDSLPFPYKTNSWLTPILVADNVEKTYLGAQSYDKKEPQTIYQLPVFPHPWALYYSKNDQGHQGLLLTPERMRVTAGAQIPAPEGGTKNSSDKMSELQVTFDVATMQIDPGFQSYAIKVHRMGDYDADLLMRAVDDPDFDEKGLAEGAALKMTVVRGSPFLYFTATDLPQVTLNNFYTSPDVTNDSGTITVSGTDVAYTVITGTYPPDNRELSTVIFYPAKAATYTPTPVIDSKIVFSNTAGNNYFVLCTLPDATFGDGVTLTKLAEAAFSYPTNTTVTYSYNQGSSYSEARYAITATNVLGGPVKSINGLMPHHYQTISWHENEEVLQGSPSPLTNGKGSPMAFLTVRGRLQVYGTSTFTCRYPYPGILPWMPVLNEGDKEGRDQLKAWIYDAFVAQRGSENPPYTAYKAGVGQDAYNLMKFLGRNVLAASSIADVEGDVGLAETIFSNTRDAIEVYFRQNPTLVQEKNEGQAPYYCYYDPEVGTINQYPSVAAAPGNTNFPSDTGDPPYDGFGTLSRCNDHHFHYGYMINAAAIVALRDPSWGAAWKDTINQMVFDVANDPNINTNPAFAFPAYRNWEPYINHGMAAGFNWNVVIGNNEESVSEHINFWNGVILWAAATGQQDLMNQAIAHYSAIVHSSFVYWFDPKGNYNQIIADLNGPSWPINWPGNGAVRMFDGYARWDTFFGTHPAAGRGIMMFPQTPGTFYHAMAGDYINEVMKSYDNFVGQNGHDIDPLNPYGLSDWRTVDNQWLSFMNFYSVFTKYAAMGNPNTALDRYYPVEANYKVVNGIIPWDKLTDPGDSGVFVYHFVRYLQTHGRPDPWVTATNSPFFMTFYDAVKGERTYVGYNYTDSPLTVTFSDGGTLENVPAHSMAEKTIVQDN
ncbi:MAG: hypothetical protein LJE96_02295 [Deltaproteobacteria bacterium]|nr:hypothetical protein [Deltaproteobacteria bacterium]